MRLRARLADEIAQEDMESLRPLIAGAPPSDVPLQVRTPSRARPSTWWCLTRPLRCQRALSGACGASY